MIALDILYDGPDFFAPRAAWCLDTMLAPLGRRARLVTAADAAAGCALAYAPAPVPDVPTIPLSADALALYEAGRALPRDSFRRMPGATVGAFPAGEGFATPFDLVASAFALLACWDERTCSRRDLFGRLPYEDGVFAANRALAIERPAVDTYVALLRAVLAPRLAELGAAPLPPPGWAWGDGGFAVAVTHDVDNLWQWTPKGFVLAARRAALAARHRRWGAVQAEGRGVWRWATIHRRAGTDPFWTFRPLIDGERDRALTSTFFVLAGHTHRYDGDQPKTYARMLPEAFALLRGGNEVGLHGNHAERLDAALLGADRDDLARRWGGPVDGIRYHYLRCLYHETLPLADAAGFAYDSSLAFAEHEGFRCGASFPFHPYSLRDERPLRILELPLAVMDTTLRGDRYRALDAAAAESAARETLAHARATGGCAALLWHHHSFDPSSARGFDALYWRLLDWAVGEGAALGPAATLVEHWRRATEGDAEGASAASG